MDLQGEGALARSHGPEGEAQHGHACKLHPCRSGCRPQRTPKAPPATIAWLSGRTSQRSSSQPSSPSAGHGPSASCRCAPRCAGGAPRPLGVNAPSASTSPRAPRRVDRRGPCVVAPLARGLSAARGTSPDAAWTTSASMPSEPGVHEAGDVPVAAELVQQRDGVPEREVAAVGPRQAGVTGVQGAAGGGAGLERRRASSAARATSGSSSGVAERPGAARRRRPRAELEHRGGRGAAHAAGIAWCTTVRVEVEERGDRRPPRAPRPSARRVTRSSRRSRERRAPRRPPSPPARSR